MNWKIPLFKIYQDEEDIRAVEGVLRRGMHWAAGPEIAEFEIKISSYIGTKYSVSFNSGTSALHALLLAYGIKAGNEVIVPSFTFVATANAPLFVGAKPIFADIEEKTYGLDPEDVKEKITKRTKCIIPVHYGGCPCQIRELREIANDNNLILIEDAAEAFGAKIKNDKIGTLGDSSFFSFCQNKIITTGEGGAVVTNSREIYEKLKLVRSHGRKEDSGYFSTPQYVDYVGLGYNFRMPSMNAALGITQLGKVEKLIAMRRKNSEYLSKKLSCLTEVETPEPPEGFYHVYQMYTIKLKGEKGLRDKLSRYLAGKGIMTKVFFHPVHLTYFYKKKLGYKDKLPVTEEISKRVLTLPMFPSLTKEEMNYIAGAIERFFEEC